MIGNTVVPVMNGHPRDQAKVSILCRWPLIRGNLTLKCVGRGIDNVAVQGRWPLTTVYAFVLWPGSTKKWTIRIFYFSYCGGGLWWFACISLVSLAIVPNSGGGLWSFAVVCGHLRWFVINGLRWFVFFSHVLGVGAYPF